MVWYDEIFLNFLDFFGDFLKLSNFFLTFYSLQSFTFLDIHSISVQKFFPELAN